MYSLCSYQSIQLPRNTIHKMHSPGPQSRKAFSLVEVSLALAIVGIAFTVIIAMLPVGLRQSRTAIDTTNEARILSGMNSILLATEYEQLTTQLAGQKYYFDADGGYLEKVPISEDPAADSPYKAARVYQAGFIIGLTATTSDRKDINRLVHVVFGKASDAANSALSDIINGTVAMDALKKNSPVKIAPIIIAKMDKTK